MKKIIVVLWILIVVVLYACGDIDYGTSNKSEKIEVADNYLGECGYILTNQIYDYSKLCKTTYEYDSNVKLPFKQVEGTKLVYDEYGNPVISDVDESKLQAYIESLTEAGYEVCNFTDINGQKIMAFGHNMRVILYYYSEAKEIYLYIYAGNVVGDRRVTIEKARKLIDDSKLLEEQSAYNDYYVIAIETESVRNKGYFEFLVLSMKQEYNPDNILQSCYYMITDGKKINLFENDIINTEFPTNVNIGDDDRLVTTVLKSNGLSGNVAIETYIRTYKLIDESFQKDSEYNTSVNLLNGRAVLSKYENGKIDYYELIRSDKKYVNSRNLWIIDESELLKDNKYFDEYNMQN